eukprot:2591481-Rhodomonas_salina.4
MMSADSSAPAASAGALNVLTNRHRLSLTANGSTLDMASATPSPTARRGMFGLNNELARSMIHRSELEQGLLKSGLVRKMKSDMTWVTRLMMVSKHNVCFLDADKEHHGEHHELEIIDHIPLHEIVQVQFANSASRALHSSESFKMKRSDSRRARRTENTGSGQGSAFVPGSEHRDVHNTFHIRTTNEGHNCGKTYTVSSEDCEEWMDLIQKISRERALQHQHRDLPGPLPPMALARAITAALRVGSFPGSIPFVLRVRYAMSGTNLGYRGTRLSQRL